MDYRIRSTQQSPALIMKRYGSSQHLYLRPIPDHQWQVLEDLERYCLRDGRPMVLDSGCGRAMSTLFLQRRLPQYLVVGLDRSEHRLCQANLPQLASNLWGAEGGPYLARVNLVDMWRLLAHVQWPIVYHCLWYPNPWPKPKHVKRRFHAHPVFRTMLGLSPVCELRTQWSLYADEFCLSVRQHNMGYAINQSTLVVTDPCTHFEQKYQQAACPLWQVRVTKIGHHSAVGF